MRRGVAGVLLVYGDYARQRNDTVALIAQVERVLDKNIATVPFADFGGVWWRAQESGSGITLIQRADHQMTGTFYTYDDDGESMWLVISGGQWESSSRWRGRLYRTRYAGTGALSGGVVPALVATEDFGAVIFEFADATHAQLELQFPSSSRSIPIERFPF